jgi:hypothetical protein
MKHRRHLQFLVPIRNTRASPLLVLFAFSGSLLCQARPSETSEARSAPRLAVSPAGSPPVKSSLPAQLAGTQSPGPPVYVEGTFGNDRFDLQTFISKQFTEHGKAGLLSITSAQGRYDNESDSFEFVNVTQLNYDLYKGLSPTLGVALNRQVGFNTSVGFQYLFVRPTLLLVFAPSVFISGTHDVQNVFAMLYQPALGKQWHFYANVQVLDDYIVSQALNARSFAHIRLGGTRSRCTIGLGVDLDWYGQPEDFRRNIGPFIGYSF